MAEIQPPVEKLKGKFGASIQEVKTFRGEVTVTVSKEALYEICRFLYADPDLQFRFLTDLCGVDNLSSNPAL